MLLRSEAKSQRCWPEENARNLLLVEGSSAGCKPPHICGSIVGAPPFPDPGSALAIEVEKFRSALFQLVQIDVLQPDSDPRVLMCLHPQPLAFGVQLLYLIAFQRAVPTPRVHSSVRDVSKRQDRMETRKQASTPLQNPVF